METIGNRIKSLRNERRISQITLAQAIGVGQASICEWEKDLHEPTLNGLKSIAIFFGVTTDFLLGLENEDGTKKQSIIFNIQNNYNK